MLVNGGLSKDAEGHLSPHLTTDLGVEMNRNVEFSVLVGKTIEAIWGGAGDDSIKFTCTDGTQYQMYHYQDCCESVYVEDIAGDLQDIVGSPILVAEELSSSEDPPGVKLSDYRESFTWTFYKLDTAKGGVTIRWYGSSNGYYSERVDFHEVTHG
jgi:hypothetical protein